MKSQIKNKKLGQLLPYLIVLSLVLNGCTTNIKKDAVIPQQQVTDAPTCENTLEACNQAVEAQKQVIDKQQEVIVELKKKEAEDRQRREDAEQSANSFWHSPTFTIIMFLVGVLVGVKVF